MSNTKEFDVNLFKKAIAEGDEWLLQNGVISDVSKNTIITNIYAQYPRVRLLDFDLDEDERILDMRLYVPFWTLLFITIFRKRQKLLDDVFHNLEEYLRGQFQIRVQIERLKAPETL